MQFVKGGPDVPEALIQAHEEGRVVMFCGAGVSYPARLPGFKDLVAGLYSKLNVIPTSVQMAAIKSGQFDTAVELLEQRIQGGRQVTRKALTEILVPDYKPKNAATTHAALLTLAKNREGSTRLVTTNFDRVFEHVIAKQNAEVHRFKAPLLPVPKKRWNGLVYLHGLIPDKPSSAELDQLVVSSGDFGTAYLTERWAARFVSELFRNFTVCFVGYSLNDPVLRYMTDALAADRNRGESISDMYAFGNYAKSAKFAQQDEWEAKGVTPILYRNHNHHAYLHSTLREWAATYEDGSRGKQRIVLEGALARPLQSTEQDDFVGRVLWALSDRDGLPAKQFADMDPVPSLDWLEPLAEKRFNHEDLPRFGVPPKGRVDHDLGFSFVNRPAPYKLAAPMALIGHSFWQSGWDGVMVELARWLLRHLGDPYLLLWFAGQGSELSARMANLIEDQLNQTLEMVVATSDEELEQILANAPYAIPGSRMRTYWRMFLTGLVKGPSHDFNFFGWNDRFKSHGLTPSMRMELRELLSPKVVFSKRIIGPLETLQKEQDGEPVDPIEWEIQLCADHVHDGLPTLRENQNWSNTAPALLPDLTYLLRDTFQLKEELGGADNGSDSSYIDQPSIGQHEQNRGFRDWTALVELLRDAWLEVAKKSVEMARYWVETWWNEPYPIFRRLVFFAATDLDVFSRHQAVDWLLADESWWLWSVETQREVIRLLVASAPAMNQDELLRIEQALLAGPPRKMFKENVDVRRLERVKQREIWLRLAKIKMTGVGFGNEAARRFEELSADYPDWALAEDESDEFPFWMGDGNEWREHLDVPTSLLEMVEWLRKHPDVDHWQDDNWQERCKSDFPATFGALRLLAIEGYWPADRWREALHAWAEESLVAETWEPVSEIVVAAGPEMLADLASPLSWWLRAVASCVDVHVDRFLMLITQVLALEHEIPADDDQDVGRAINHPVGHVTEALLRFWLKRPLEDEQLLPENIKAIFTQICDVSVEKFRHGRVLLASRVIALFRVDPPWTTLHVIPLFDWMESISEARAAWNGFLWSPRLYRPLLQLLKPAFLNTASHYDHLGDHATQFASLLTFAALDRSDTFTWRELAEATNNLPQAGLEVTARNLARGLESAGEQREANWRNRLYPYLRKVWPMRREIASVSIANSFAKLCLASGEEFPNALDLLRIWFREVDYPDPLVIRMRDDGRCEQFPGPSLDFLNLLISDQARVSHQLLEECLNRIRATSPGLENTASFRRLDRVVDHNRRLRH